MVAKSAELYRLFTMPLIMPALTPSWFLSFMFASARDFRNRL